MTAKKRSIKPVGFMHQYRQWERMRKGVRASLDKDVIARFGYSMALAFDRYDGIKHKVGRCNVHVRINYRANAINALGGLWRERSLELNKMWRSYR